MKITDWLIVVAVFCGIYGGSTLFFAWWDGISIHTPYVVGSLLMFLCIAIIAGIWEHRWNQREVPATQPEEETQTSET